MTMALKYKFKTKDEIPAEHLPLYAEREGAWILDVDGAVEKTKLDEFRTTNVSLLKERDDLKKRYEGIDPDAVKALVDEKRQLEEAQQIKAGEVEKVVENRIKGVKADLEKQITTLAGERDSLTARLTSIQIDQGVLTVATKRGLRPTAIPDITARARSIFRLVNGVPTAFEPDGKALRYGKDGLTPMTLEEWVDAQVSEAPHLFESNAGGGGGSATSQYGNGSGGGSSAASHRGRNPFKREHWNLTEQMKLQKTDPQLAARLKAAA